ncbi:MAG: AI-2E family transporter [Bacteroidales bacterium]|nr:AI-2E family transporter [Bacteroidales bacterium]MCM1415808.1 AI-2E family transporter [bacterium]MCM1422698.1 AI-2E family transporter [bacterium]
MGAFFENKLIKGCVVTALVWFFFRYLFGLAAPFLLAFVLITLLYPTLERVQKRIPVRKKYLAVGIILPILLLTSVGLWAVFSVGIGQLQGLPTFCRQVERQAEAFFHDCCCQLDGKFGWESERIETYVIEQMNVIMENVQIQIAPQLLSSSYSCFKSLLAAVGFLAITCIAVFLLEKDYTGMVEWLKGEESVAFLWTAFEGVLSYITTFLKAQGVILLVIAVSASVTLSVAGVEGCVFFGILAGLLDMLPFIGTGIVLVPLALWQLLNGWYGKMAVCLVLYGACILIREFLEPRLIGSKMGISPVYILFAVYAGVKLFGVSGIVKGPLALIVICEILRDSSKKLTNPPKVR